MVHFKSSSFLHIIIFTYFSFLIYCFRWGVYLNIKSKCFNIIIINVLLSTSLSQCPLFTLAMHTLRSDPEGHFPSFSTESNRLILRPATAGAWLCHAWPAAHAPWHVSGCLFALRVKISIDSHRKIQYFFIRAPCLARGDAWTLWTTSTTCIWQARIEDCVWILTTYKSPQIIRCKLDTSTDLFNEWAVGQTLWLALK